MLGQINKKALILPLLVLLAASLVLAGGCAGSGSTPAKVQSFGDISTAEASAMIQENAGNDSFVILDVRTAQEYATGHIADTANMDFYATSFQDDLNKLDKGKAYLVYCRTGNRSRQAVDMMQKLGFTEVYNMSGGIVQWQAEGHPTAQ
ncbi:MAG: rhodanese-like domain-containing protein [Chloroflexota bacterium]